MKLKNVVLISFVTFLMATINIGCQDSVSSFIEDDSTNEASVTNGDNSSGNNSGNGSVTVGDNENGSVHPSGTTGNNENATGASETNENSNNNNYAGNSGITIKDDGIVNIVSRNAIYIGEDSETIDYTTYLVKKYAELTIEDCPYFYTYYKFYYLNDKLRQVIIFPHDVGSDMDYKYTEFVEHSCNLTGNYSEKQIYTYHENGKLAFYSFIQNSNGINYRYETYFNEDGIKTSYLNYYNDLLYVEYEYYPNGKNKTQRIYDINASPSYLSIKLTFYEDGKTEYSISYLPDGSESSRQYTSYYDSGNKKTHDEYFQGKITRINTYFDDNSSSEKLYVNYNTDATISYFEYRYDSGYLKYYYTDSGYLYTYPDNKTKSSSTSSSVYSNKQAYTDVRAKNLVESLKA